MSLRITGDYRSAKKGETLHITADGQVGAVTAYSGLDQIQAAAMYLRRCRRQAATIAAARYSFEDSTLELMRREAQRSINLALWCYLRGVINLRAGFIC